MAIITSPGFSGRGNPSMVNKLLEFSSIRPQVQRPDGNVSTHRMAVVAIRWIGGVNLSILTPTCLNPAYPTVLIWFNTPSNWKFPRFIRLPRILFVPKAYLRCNDRTKEESQTSGLMQTLFNILTVYIATDDGTGSPTYVLANLEKNS